MKHVNLALLSLLSLPVFSQSNIVSSGTSVSNSSGSISYSVGQIDYISVSGAGGSINQGNQQAFELFENKVSEYKGIHLSAFVYPNPTNNFVLLKIEGLELNHLNYKVFNAEGKELSKNDISSLESKISFSTNPSGIYFLNIYTNSQEIKSFKIIKNN